MMNIIFTLVKNLDWILSYFRGDNQKRKIGYPLFGYLLYIYITNPFVLLCCTLLVASQRHFPSDVLEGVLVGLWSHHLVL
jgi:hypothetical protein